MSGLSLTWVDPLLLNLGIVLGVDTWLNEDIQSISPSRLLKQNKTSNLKNTHHQSIVPTMSGQLNLKKILTL